jgi:23S rRNA (cytidine1920-2'-O)/16S rRNA (cytidine1409-2'-O)-methyltransferase
VRRRLDTELVRRGLVASRTEAASAIRAGRVKVDGRHAQKTSTLVAPGEPVTIEGPPRPFVSRGGEKLDAALARFGIDVSGRRCLDAGASTGGFTDCLLRWGAAEVVAVDVGYGQLAWTIRTDPRVTVLERTNVRHLTVGDLPFRPDLIAVDLSFISLSAALPSLAEIADPSGDVVTLVKPQFEAGRADVGKGGVVRDPAVWRRVLLEVMEVSRATGLAPRTVMASPLLGPAGNAEFLLHAVPGGPEAELDVEGAIRDAEVLRAAS